MKRIIYFELKKIFDRKFNVIAMLTGYFIILFCVFYFIRDYSFYDKESGGYIEGLKAYELSREKNEEMTDYLTEDYLTSLTKSIQAKNIPLDTDEGYTEVIRPMRDMILVLCKNYMVAGEAFDWNRINEISNIDSVLFSICSCSMHFPRFCSRV